MRVMVTGATGFIGYHTAIALLDAGHELSLLVRSVEKMETMFGAGRIDDYTVGDITDVDSVRSALQDCDAVIHVAALVSTRAADAERVGRTNVEGVENVIGSAVEMGVDSIVHVSSITALFDPAAQVLDEHSPPGVGATGYGRSKVACERFVRELQDSGAPVYITYPGTVLGPQTPALTEAHVGLQTYLSAFVPVMSSGNQYVDARDLAEAHRIIVEDSTLAARPGPKRYVLGGHYIPWNDLGPLLEELTHRKLLKIPLSGRLMRLMGRACDRLDRYFDLDMPMTEEGLGYATGWVPMDNRWAEQQLGIELRPVEETLADTIRWLCDEGHITAEQAGVLAG
jgi:nucleoside-diphosphate-sugar epimerase